MITEQERKIIEQEIREKLLEERRAYKRNWRANNRDKVRESNLKYYKKMKDKKENKTNG